MRTNQASSRKARPVALLPALVLVACASVRVDQDPKLQALVQELERRIPGLMSESKVPGLSMVLIRGQRIAWHGCFGVRAAERAEPIDRDTIFEAASMSKPLFTYAVLKLIEESRLDLDTPLDDYLPGPYLPDDPRAGAITARMVMAHTTGLPNWRKGGWRAGGPLPLRFPPGTRFSYSGEGYLYLQRAVENVTGTGLAAFMDERLLRPLSMSRSSYEWHERFRPNFAGGHDKDGQLKTGRRLYEQGNAAFSLYSTPHDYGLFLLEMMNADRNATWSLSAASVAAMLEPQETPQIDRAGKRGLGWGLASESPDGWVDHGGSNGTGFRCYSRFHPERGDGLVIMTNAVSGAAVWKAIVGLVDEAARTTRSE